MNVSDSQWYSKKRRNVESRWRDSSPLRNKSEVFSSPSEKYKIRITPFVFRLERLWSYTFGEVFDGKKAVTSVLRDYSSFPLCWCEGHPDGHDYMVCGEDYQGQTVIRLDTGERVDFVEASAEKRLSWCWNSFFVSPDKTKIIVSGCFYTSQYELRIFDFQNPFNLPFKRAGQDFVEYYDELLGWRDNSTILVSKTLEYRTSDGVLLDSLPVEDQHKAIEDPQGTWNKKVIFAVDLEGNKTEVYSEWVSPPPPLKKKKKGLK